MRPLLATQLRGRRQVGALLDARLELNVCYELFARLAGRAGEELRRRRLCGSKLGPWIGAELALRSQPATSAVERALLRAWPDGRACA